MMTHKCECKNGALIFAMLMVEHPSILTVIFWDSRGNLKKDCTRSQYPYAGVVKSERVFYPKCTEAVTKQSRATNPAWLYKDLEQNHRYILFLNPQENVCKPFHNNLNTRLLERDNFKPSYPCLNPQ